MRKKTMRVCALAVGFALIVGSVPSFAKSNTEKKEQMKIGVLSDAHYFSKSLYSDCEDFTTAMNSDRKMFRESGAIIDSALDQMVEDEVEMILVSGDLTKDGEQVNHEEFADKLEKTKSKLKEKGVDAKIYVINGNHDINNPNGKDYSSGSAEDADRTTVEEFKKIYKDFGYGKDTEQYSENTYKGGCLSYVAHPAEGFTLIAVDSGKYSSDQTSTGQDLQETGGVVSEDLLKWVEEKTKEAKENGDAVMVMQHHGVVEHFSQEPTVMADYLVDNFDEVQERYAAAGVNNVFTGHMHANDIAEHKAENGNVMYDIETGSLVTYPSPTRIVNVTNYEGQKENCVEYDVHTKLVKSIDYVDNETGGKITDLTSYGKRHTLSVEVVQTMLTQQLLGPAMDAINAGGGVRTVLAQLLGTEEPQNVDGDITDMIFSMLPQTKEEGWDLEAVGVKLKVYCDSKAGHIKISQSNEKAKLSDDRVLSNTATLTKSDGTAVEFEMPEAFADELRMEIAEKEVTGDRLLLDAELENTPKVRGLFDPIELYVTYDNAKGIIGDTLTQTDEKLLSNKSAVFEVVNTAVDELLNSKVDEEHTVFELVNEIYQGHLAGEEQPSSWVKNAIEKVESEKMLSEKLKAVLKSDSKTMSVAATLLGNININLKDAVEKGNDSIITSVAHGAVGGMISSGADILKLIDFSTLISDDIYAQIDNLAYSVAESMAYDDNYVEDNNTRFVFGTLDSQGPDGNIDENQGNGNENTGTDDEANQGNVDTNTLENVQTGDSAQVLMYVILTAGALIAIYTLKRVNRN